MCAGKSIRYPKPYPKVLEPILNEPNYKRTIRLLNENGIDDVIITVSDEDSHYFDYQNKIIGLNEREIDRFRNVKDSINNETLILYGDVIYHEDDIKTILNNLNDEIKFFGRFMNNMNLNYILFGEIFGIYIANKNKFFNAVDITATKFEKKLIEREIGLDVFKELQLKITDLITLSEYTDDFDIIEKYNLMKDIYENKLNINDKNKYK